jgi:hypothetical protein
VALAVSSLTSGADTSNTTSYASASIAPASNALVLAFVTTRYIAANFPGGAPALSGNGLTWVRIAELIGSPNSSVGAVNFSVFRAMGASPSSGAVTITPPAQRAGAMWNVVQVTGAPTGSDGANAIRQIQRSFCDPTHDAITVRMRAGLAGSAVIGAFYKVGDDESFTLGAGLTTLGEVTHVTPASMQVACYSTTFDTAPDVDWATAREGGGIALEVIDAGASLDATVRRNPTRRSYKTAAINVGASGENTIITEVAGKRIKVYAYLVQPTGSVDWFFEEGAEDVSASLTAQAREGVRAAVDPPAYLFATSPGNDVGIDLSAAVAVDGWVAYWDDDEF